jgi:hypothetical protein
MAAGQRANGLIRRARGGRGFATRASKRFTSEIADQPADPHRLDGALVASAHEIPRDEDRPDPEHPLEVEDPGAVVDVHVDALGERPGEEERERAVDEADGRQQVVRVLAGAVQERHRGAASLFTCGARA